VFGAGQADTSDNFQYQCNTFNDAGACTTGTTNVPRKLYQNKNLMMGSAQPWLVPDPTSPAILSVIASDDPTNTNHGQGFDDMAVYMVRSTNQGLGKTSVMWSSPTQVDGDTVKSLQFMPTASQDIDRRCMVVSYYDNRNYPNTLNGTGDSFLDVYLRASEDDGTSWGPETRVNDTRIDPDLNAPDYFGYWTGFPKGYKPTYRIGEYNGVAVAHGVAHAVWTGNGAGQQQIFYDNARMCMDPAMPNPSGNVVAAAQSSSITSVFAIGSDGALYRRWVSGTGAWQGPSRIGGANLASPGAPVAVGRLNSNELYAFFVGKDGRIYVTNETNDGAWSSPTALSAAGFAKSGAYLATGVQSGTQIDLFVVDTSGTLQGFAKQNGTPWSANIPLANSFASSGAALATAAHPSLDQLDVFAVGSDGSVVATFVVGLGPFASPFSLTAANVAYAGNPIATGMQGADQLDVFYVGRDGAIHAIWFEDAGPVNGPVALTATSFAIGALSTIQRGTTLNLFTVNDSGDAVRLWVDGTGTWNGPTLVTTSKPAFQGAGIGAAPQGNQTDVFIVGNVYMLEATFDGTNWSKSMPLLP
jgi:hypothetical protein